MALTTTACLPWVGEVTIVAEHDMDSPELEDAYLEDAYERGQGGMTWEESESLRTDEDFGPLLEEGGE